MKSQFFDTSTANWTQAWIEKYLLVDEIDLFQIGQVNEGEFEKIVLQQVSPSAYTSWPTRDNPSRYKINSIWLELSKSQTTIERQTYSMLELMGDVGGLLDGLKIVGGFFVTPIASFALRVKLLASGFKLLGAKNTVVTEGIWFPCAITREQRRYSKLRMSAEHRITKQLDLFSFLRQQRMLFLALLSNIKADKQKIIRRLSLQIIRESEASSFNESDQSNGSDDCKTLSPLISAGLDKGLAHCLNLQIDRYKLQPSEEPPEEISAITQS